MTDIRERTYVAEPQRSGRRPRRSAASMIGSVLLDVAALAGAVCIVLVILAFCFHITLIMFKTGSMSPTIPTGSVALVREIPASAIAVGDVVTVDRIGQLPVTHRVTSVLPGDRSDMRTITLKGDANMSEDPAPYDVATVRIVLGSIPGLAYVVIWFSNPWVLAGLTFACSVLVTWAFWPRSARRRTAKPPPRQEEIAGERARHRARIARRASSVLMIAVVTGGVASVSGVALPAGAEPGINVATGSALVLAAIGDPVVIGGPEPAAAAPWEVGIATNPDVGPGPGGRLDTAFWATTCAVAGVLVGVVLLLIRRTKTKKDR